MLSEVPTLPIPNLRNVPDMLRRFAKRMESGEIDEPMRIIVIHQDQDAKVRNFCFGDMVTTTELIGLLEIAKIKLASDFI